MSNVGSPFERLVNGENSIDVVAAAAAAAVATAATGAVSGGSGRIRGDEGNCVGGGGGGSVCGSYSGAGSCGSSGNNNVDSGGIPTVVVAAAVTGGAISGASNSPCGVTFPDARGTTPVNSCCKTTVSRICGGNCRCCIYTTDVLLSSSTTGATTRTLNGDNVTATTNSRELALGNTGTTTLLLDAGSIDARTVSNRRASSNNSNTTTTAAVVFVDAALSLFHDNDVAATDGDDEDDEDRRRYHHHGNMVAAMNEHLSSATTTTTSSPPVAANAIRTSGNTVVISSSSSSASSALMTATTTIAGGNSNLPTMMMSNIGSGANNSNSCNSARNQEFQEVDGDDGKTITIASTTSTTTAAAAAAAGILSFPCDFDHMYASMTDGGAPAAVTATVATTLGVSPLRGNEPRHNDLTEVKHLKELLLLHLDLIQQQSEQIVTKDKLLAALRQENETLKLRLERMERRVSLQKLKSECSENSTGSEHLGTCSPTSVNSVNVPSTSELHRTVQCESSNSLHETFKIRLNTSGGITTVKQEPLDNQIKIEVKQEPINEERFEWEEKKKRRSDPTPVSTGSKKKRGLSCSSAISTDGVQDKILGQTLHETSRKSDRKTKSLVKKESFLTTEEHYYTAVGDPNYTLSLKQSSPVETSNSLEVPHWRLKTCTSCYTMEGTENLDDEIFNKRHLKLENDERRRKRWDVQRIREQRHIEKLKQRQERQNHQATCYNTNHIGPCPSSMEEETITSLWPDIEQIQSLQVDPHLPVTAFGALIPSFIPSEFSLPWSNTTRIKSRRPKRSTNRRKSIGRRKV